MLQQALQKMKAEIASPNKKHKYIPAIGAFLINHVRQNPEHAGLIMSEDKSIVGSIDEMMAEASKTLVNGKGQLSDEEAFNIVLRYYGVVVPEADSEPPAQQPINFVLSLDDLLD